MCSPVGLIREVFMNGSLIHLVYILGTLETSLYFVFLKLLATGVL